MKSGEQYLQYQVHRVASKLVQRVQTVLVNLTHLTVDTDLRPPLIIMLGSMLAAEAR